MAKPGSIPTWATNIVNDPTSGIDNRVAPSAGEQLTGDVPLNVKPSRQHHNWLFWLTGLWITYFDGVIDQDVTVGSTPDFAGIQRTAANITIQTITSGNLTLTAADDLANNAKNEFTILSANISSLVINAGAGTRTIKGKLSIKSAGDVENFSVDNSNGNVAAAGKIIAGADLEIFSGQFINSASTDTIRSGNPTDIDSTELEQLSDGSNVDSLHKHSTGNLDDTTASGADLNSLTDGSDADALHKHNSSLSFTDPRERILIRVGSDMYYQISATGYGNVENSFLDSGLTGLPMKSHMILQLIKSAAVTGIAYSFDIQTDVQHANNQIILFVHDEDNNLVDVASWVNTAIPSSYATKSGTLNISSVSNGKKLSCTIVQRVDSATLAVSGNDIRMRNLKFLAS